MTNYFIYLAETNVVFIILYTAYRLVFEKDRNFTVRRIYLLGILGVSFLLPLIPETIRATASRFAPLSIPLEGITVYAYEPENPVPGYSSPWRFAAYLYIIVLALGGLRILFQLAGILWAVRRSGKIRFEGKEIFSNKRLQASSFFGFVFLDPASLGSDSASHILVHENIHRKQLHSLDRILAELFVMLNWFNPLSWMFRNSVVQNLEYMADRGVMNQGISRDSYQLSMINQYIGSASITNSFSQQIKKRINMLNKNYKTGSSWKIAMILPLALVAIVAISCTEKQNDKEPVYSISEQGNEEVSTLSDPGEQLFYVVDEMPAFNGGEPIEFRRYIAENIRYPEEAIKNGVTGKVFIKFIVTKTGKVKIPDQSLLAEQEGKSLDEVVVVGYRTLNEDDPMPDEKYIELLKREVIRVVSESPDWQPGKQRGVPVNVLFTFPVNFALQ
jgi:hypothetical protein